MRKRNIALIGFRATGKTSVGKILAHRLDRVFIDMDQFLAASAGRDIACWVRLEGWDSFRKSESELLKNLCSRPGLVVATGGGIILNPENRIVLKRDFITVWLKASTETIQSRISKDPDSSINRPPLSELPLREEIEKMLGNRESLYLHAADFEIDTELKSADEISLEIISRLESTFA